MAAQLKKRLAERMLSAELSHHLANEGEGSKNHCSGSRPKKVLTARGAVAAHATSQVVTPGPVAAFQECNEGPARPPRWRGSQALKLGVKLYVVTVAAIHPISCCTPVSATWTVSAFDVTAAMAVAASAELFS